MRALVIFESAFGNTREIAQAIADGLSTRSEVDLVEVGEAPKTLDPDVGLVVLGGPTQAFGMSRPGTRADALRQAGRPDASAAVGVREWLDGLRTAPSGMSAATFDTRIGSPRVPGSAARGAHKRLRHLGLVMVAPAESFFVTGTSGPLEPGEAERAREWGVELARLAG
jgi:hypothetical protein